MGAVRQARPEVHPFAEQPSGRFRNVNHRSDPMQFRLQRALPGAARHAPDRRFRPRALVPGTRSARGLAAPLVGAAVARRRWCRSSRLEQARRGSASPSWLRRSPKGPRRPPCGAGAHSASFSHARVGQDRVGHPRVARAGRLADQSAASRRSSILVIPEGESRTSTARSVRRILRSSRARRARAASRTRSASDRVGDELGAELAGHRAWAPSSRPRVSIAGDALVSQLLIASSVLC